MKSTQSTVLAERAESRAPARSADARVEPRKWSARRTLVFLVVVCGAFWAAVAFAVAKLLG